MAVAAATFQQKLESDQIAEGLIARYLISQGWVLLHVSQIAVENGKGTRLLLKEEQLIAPDLQGWKGQQARFFDVKSKGTASYYRRKARWQTGVDAWHYHDYRRVQENTGTPVWLLFLQKDDAVSNAPPGAPPCPTGLFGCPIDQPYSDEGSFMRNGREFKMVYWGLEDLKKLATLAEVLAVAEEANAK